MRVLLFVFCLSLYSMVSSAQKISINESSEIIDKITRSGLGTVIELDQKNVTKAWEKHLKNYGKVESSKGVFTIQVAKIPSVSSQPCKIYSEVKNTKKGALVWWAIDLGDHFVTSSNDRSAFKSAEKILQEFAYSAYVEDINEQIKDAEKALSGAVKSHEKEIKNGERLVSDVDKNKKEKEKLQAALEQNAKDLDQLHKDIESNKKDQKAANEEVEKMKKAVEVVKQKVNNISK
jgi:hypothetical protein